jgi:hypothetical protein
MDPGRGTQLSTAGNDQQTPIFPGAAFARLGARPKKRRRCLTLFAMAGVTDKRKTEAFREAARLRARLQWTPDARAAQAELTREKMKAPGVSARIADRTRAALADPDVRQRHLANTRAAMLDPEVSARISVATKLGMERWRASLLALLLETWRRAPQTVRRRFLTEIMAVGASIEAGSPPNPHVAAPIGASSVQSALDG